MGENVLVVCSYDSPARSYTHRHIHPPAKPLTYKNLTDLPSNWTVEGREWVGVGGEGTGGIIVTFFFLLWEIPKTQWVTLVSLGLLTKEVSLLLDSPFISTGITKEADLNLEQNTKLTEYYKQA